MQMRSAVRFENSGLNPENLEFDPIEADRFKQEDIALNKSLEDLDSYLLNLRLKYSRNEIVKGKIAEIKSWIIKNRLILSAEQCKSIKTDFQEFIANGNF